MKRPGRISWALTRGLRDRGGRMFAAGSLVASLAGPAWCAAPSDTAGTPATTRVGATAPLRRSPVALEGRPVLGVDSAPIVVVEIANFKCTHCRKFHEEIFPRLREDYINPGKVQWVVLNASDVAADEFAPIFGLARCAQRQGKYWELLDQFFAVARRPSSMVKDLVTQSPLLNREELEICLRDRTLRNAVAADFVSYAELHVRGTPTFVIWKLGRDGKRTEATIAGAQTLDYYQRALDKLLATP